MSTNPTLNVQAAIAVIDRIHNHRSSLGNHIENNMRVKLSDLREVVEALLKPECMHGWRPPTPSEPSNLLAVCVKCNESRSASQPPPKKFSGYATQTPVVKECDHEWSAPARYIWCLVDGDLLIPHGHGKTWEYAMKCKNIYSGPVRLYKLVPIEDI